MPGANTNRYKQRPTKISHPTKTKISTNWTYWTPSVSLTHSSGPRAFTCIIIHTRTKWWVRGRIIVVIVRNTNIREWPSPYPKQEIGINKCSCIYVVHVACRGLACRCVLCCRTFSHGAKTAPLILDTVKAIIVVTTLTIHPSTPLTHWVINGSRKVCGCNLCKIETQRQPKKHNTHERLACYHQSSSAHSFHWKQHMQWSAQHDVKQIVHVESSHIFILPSLSPTQEPKKLKKATTADNQMTWVLLVKPASLRIVAL